MPDVLLIQGDQLVEVANLRRQPGDTLEEGATVTLTIRDEDNDPVSGASWPIGMSEDPAGTYSVGVPDNIVLKGGHVYTLEVKAEATDGVQMVWKLSLLAKFKEFD